MNYFNPLEWFSVRDGWWSLFPKALLMIPKSIHKWMVILMSTPHPMVSMCTGGVEGDDEPRRREQLGALFMMRTRLAKALKALIVMGCAPGDTWIWTYGAISRIRELDYIHGQVSWGRKNHNEHEADWEKLVGGTVLDTRPNWLWDCFFFCGGVRNKRLDCLWVVIAFDQMTMSSMWFCRKRSKWFVPWSFDSDDSDIRPSSR